MRRQQAAERAQRRQERRAASEVDRTPQSPDSDHDWLTTTQVDELLGITRQAVIHRCQRDRLPYEWHYVLRWVRRDLLELVGRARAPKAGRE